MSQFKPGDLAVIINAFREQNIGKTVELVRFSSDRWIPYGNEGHQADNWRLARCWVINGNIETDQTFPGENVALTQAVAMEVHLMPLGDFQPEQQKSLEVVE
ncbi:hypothetical protein [Pseudomonas koreensis]|uniref:hypothetical protein n=1 Tax=Pseudomonas koreensis TaxID=198620 RepID=UPI0018E6D080|nr:hypothetical protein [Pseudomonas koreensis]MBI6949822.1 hypothetical protein [Pseudomonas koreensis]